MNKVSYKEVTRCNISALKCWYCYLRCLLLIPNVPKNVQTHSELFLFKVTVFHWFVEKITQQYDS